MTMFCPGEMKVVLGVTAVSPGPTAASAKIAGCTAIDRVADAVSWVREPLNCVHDDCCRAGGSGRSGDGARAAIEGESGRQAAGRHRPCDRSRASCGSEGCS